MDIDRAIRVAQTLLPGEGGITEESDPRWQALLAIAESVAEEPEAVWDFVRRWGAHHDGTLRHAVAVLLFGGAINAAGRSLQHPSMTSLLPAASSTA